jgi:hypothetical protein
VREEAKNAVTFAESRQAVRHLGEPSETNFRRGLTAGQNLRSCTDDVTGEFPQILRMIEDFFRPYAYID